MPGVEAAAVAPDTDRNLLFGVLALRAGLLDAREFAEACSAWAGRKDLPLAELLVGRGQLSPPQRALVEQLLKMSVQKHAGDAQASLVPVATERARHVLAAVADPAVRHSVLGAPGADATVVPGTVVYDPEGRGRYVLTRLHAQGGIGQVWLGLDQDRGREVALVLLVRGLRRSSAVEDAVALLRNAQDRYPTDFWLNHNLALYLYGIKPARPDEAVGYLRAALAVRPESSLAHGNLGFALSQMGRYAEAEAEYRKVIVLQPANALAHGNLGSALLNQRRVAEAVAVLRPATVLGPDSLVAHVNLGEALKRQGRYAEALTCYRRAREIASHDPRWRGPSAEWVRDAEHLVALANKVPAVLEGKVQPADIAERLALAEMCRDGPKPRYAA
jgi:tetratricopeptide (TPR) repeat protein